MRQHKATAYFLASFVTVLVFSKQTVQAQHFNYKVNGMYIYYFTKYVGWNDDLKHEVVTIGIIGESPVINDLKSITSNKRVNGQPIVVKKITPQEAVSCQIVVVSKSETNLIKQMQESLKKLPVLLVSEKAGYTNKGADICIFVDDEDNFKTKFEINKLSLQNKGLKVSRELIGLAEGTN